MTEAERLKLRGAHHFRLAMKTHLRELARPNWRLRKRSNRHMDRAYALRDAAQAQEARPAG